MQGFPMQISGNIASKVGWFASPARGTRHWDNISQLLNIPCKGCCQVHHHLYLFPSWPFALRPRLPKVVQHRKS